MGLIKIAEMLHCHIPSVQKSARRWLSGDELDRIAGDRHLIKVVRDQYLSGADYMDVNVDNFLTDSEIGRKGAEEVMFHILDLIRRHGGGRPACIDSSDPGLLEVGLDNYFEINGENAPIPLMNSVAASRVEPLAFRKRHRFSIIGMLLEQAGGDGGGFTEIAGPEAYHETARYIFDRAREAGFEKGEIFFDPTVGPLGADMVGYTRRTFEGIRVIREDAGMEGVHVCIGLSNCSEGLPRRLAINRAYLRVAIEYGLDSAILDVMQVTGKDLVDPRVLKLVRQVVESETGDTLPMLVDFAQGHPRKHSPEPRQPLPNPFKEGLTDPDQKLFILEVAPSEGNVDQIYEMAEAARDMPFTFSITDTPGGHRSPGPDTIGVEVGRIMGRQPIVNLSCKSEDRDGLVRRVLGLYHQGLRNVFSVTGDYPQEGRPSFDLDAVTLIMAVDALRRGLEFPSLLARSGKPLDGLLIGGAVSPFKYNEVDLWGQYLKLWKKRRAGADFFITQLGYDVRKFQELKLYLSRAGVGDVPVLGTVYMLNLGVVRAFDRMHVAGVMIPDDLKAKYRGKLLSRKERAVLRKMNFVEMSKNQQKIALRRSALLADILTRGLGFKGVNLAGLTDVADGLAILEIMKELGGRDWQDSYAEFREGDDKREIRFSPEDAFYLFPKGEGALLADGDFVSADRSEYARSSRAMLFFHRAFFESGTPGYGVLKWAAGGEGEGARTKFVKMLEHGIKSPSLGCEMCGDCRISDLQYLCSEPDYGCAKRQLNGPCGGADAHGMCEVHPERQCYWGEVIERALEGGQMGELYRFQLPKNPKLVHTSSWRNEVLGLCAENLDLGKPEDGLPG